MYFLNDFEIVPVAPVITGCVFVLTFHMWCISILRSLYFRIFSASFLITFLSPEIATSINIHDPFSLSKIIMSGLLFGIVLSVCTCWFQNMVTLPPWLVSTDFGTCSYQCFLSNCTPVSSSSFSSPSSSSYYYYYVIYFSCCLQGGLFQTSDREEYKIIHSLSLLRRRPIFFPNRNV